MAQIEIKEKRTTKHDIAIKGVLARDDEGRFSLISICAIVSPFQI